MVPALVLVPALAGLLAFLIRPHGLRRALLIAAALAHSALTAACFVLEPPPVLEGWFQLDAAGRLFLGITSALFLAVAVYAVGYLKREGRGPREDLEGQGRFSNAPEATFTGCLLLFLASMTLVTVSHHFGILWVAVEATTLVSAPLIYFHRHHRSLEAAWKYLLISSVGIALALMGNFLLAVAASGPEGKEAFPLVLGNLTAGASGLKVPWLKAAFLFLLVGYGTKMGLAPLHTWLPDAHSEAPSLVSALLSGALLNCAFLGILRAVAVCAGAGLEAFARDLLVGFGLLSMALAAVFILHQADYKRMLAYSSVEHMGILALGVGLGGAGASAALLHAVNHSLTKALLFLLAGNILAAYRTKTAAEVRGLLRAAPVTGGLWLAAFLAIAGSPPFGPFLSELGVFRAALEGGRPVVAAAYLGLLALVFAGMSGTVLAMAQGPRPDGRKPAGEPALAVLPPAALALAVLFLGVHVPPGLSEMIHEAARLLGRT